MKTAEGNNLLDNISSATVLTPLELNAVKLDVKHTVLTPTYLEELIGKK